MAKKRAGTAPSKACPECGAKMHSRKVKCDVCGHVFVKAAKKRVVRKKGLKTQTVSSAPALGGSAFQNQLLKEKERLQKRLDAINTLLQSER